MNKEIKEILDDFLSRLGTLKYVNENVSLDLRINKKEGLSLLDYITNLEQENKEWSVIFDTFSKRPYAHKYLEQKKKELNNPNLVGLDSEMIYKDYYDLKQENERLKEEVLNLQQKLMYLR